MKIYTKGGDKGHTSLVGGTRVLKSDPRVCAYGDVDELISYIGLLRSGIKDNSVLKKIQESLMLASAHIACDKPNDKLNNFNESEIDLLESEIDRMTNEIPPLNYFVLPSSPRISAECHIARTVCRRAERSSVAIANKNAQIELSIRYLNRLSDYLFTLARYMTHKCGEDGEDEDFWIP